jgi:hypothetical protein
MPFTVGYFIANSNGFLPDYCKFTRDYCPKVETGRGCPPGGYASARYGTWDRVGVDKERTKWIADGV